MIKKDEIRGLVDRCAQGDRHAQKIIYESYYNRYFTLCFRYLARQDSAADAVNQMFFNVFKSIDQLKEVSNFEGWMKRICINVCLTEIRKNKEKPTVHLEDQYNSSSNSVDNQALSNLTMEELLELVTQLPVQMRKVFNLFVIDGYRHEEIANLLDISEGTSKFHLHEAKARLKEAILNRQETKKIKIVQYG